MNAHTISVKKPWVPRWLFNIAVRRRWALFYVSVGSWDEVGPWLFQ